MDQVGDNEENGVTEKELYAGMDMLDAEDIKEMLRGQYSRDLFERNRGRVVQQRGDKWGNRCWRRSRTAGRKLQRSEHHAARSQTRYDMDRLGKFLMLRGQKVFQTGRGRY